LEATLNNINELLTKIAGTLMSRDNIIIIGHVRPDGDCVSSSLGLALGLRKLGKNAVAVLADPVPRIYKWLPHLDLVFKPEELDFEPEQVVVVDVSELSRIGKAVDLIKNKDEVITIDHHATGEPAGKLYWKNPSYPAAAEMIYDLLKFMKVPFDKELSQIVLTGISTDTGFFKYSNVNEKLFDDVGELVRNGAKVDIISRNVTENNKLSTIKLLMEALQKMKIELDGKLVWSYVTQKDLEKYSCDYEETAGIVGFLRTLDTAETAILFIEDEDNQVNISFRSKLFVNVNEIALHFGGGGHARAAGCSIRGSNLSVVMKDVVTYSIEFMKNAYSQR
jgi:phosphoesterase RecJ-like protein